MGMAFSYGFPIVVKALNRLLSKHFFFFFFFFLNKIFFYFFFYILYKNIFFIFFNLSVTSLKDTLYTCNKKNYYDFFRNMK